MVRVPKPGQETVTISGSFLKRLKREHALAKTKNPSLSFAAFISESAILELERRSILKEAQFISVVGIDDNVLTLKDHRRKHRFIEVFFRNNRPWCSVDNELDCIHVGFALALPEVRKRLSR
jgi:hypothetical protein